MVSWNIIPQNLTEAPMKKTIICPHCLLAAEKIILDDEPSLRFDIAELEQCCIEPSRAPEPFRCPHLISAAMGAGWITRSGAWKGWS